MKRPGIALEYLGAVRFTYPIGSLFVKVKFLFGLALLIGIVIPYKKTKVINK